MDLKKLDVEKSLLKEKYILQKKQYVLARYFSNPLTALSTILTPAKNSITISCADTSDYMPAIDNYACYFQPIARIGVDKDYYKSSEYIDRVKRYNESLRKLKNLS